MRKSLVLLLSFFMLPLCSCALLPVEDEVIAAPLLKPYESAQYSFFKVVRGDLKSQRTVNAAYLPTLTEVLSFDIGGLLIQEIKVKVGDSVRRGDVLALLECEELDDAVRELERQLDVNQKDQRDQRELYEISRKSGVNTSSATERRLAYEQKINALESDERQLELLLAQKRDEKAQRIMTAGMDGMITYVRDVKESDRSVKGERLVVVTNKSSSTFVVTGALTSYLNPGMELELNLPGAVYPARVVAPEELGIPPKDQTAYIALEDSSVTVRDNAIGSITILLEERLDTLYVPKRAVSTVRDENFVYLMEDGLRIARKVETGMTTDSFIEILSGLTEGEEIVT